MQRPQPHEESPMDTLFRRILLCLSLLVALPLAASATPPAQHGLRGRLPMLRDAGPRQRPFVLPAGARAIRDIAYGNDPAQRFDLYLPANARNAPVLFYVHGGGWHRGDKANPGIDNKLRYWLPKGYAVVSVDYRMVPQVQALEQARDIARAVATVQRRAREWNLDASRTVLMGHSAGAHLVALLGADPRLLAEAGARRPRGVVSLDAGALNVPALMSQRRVPRIYRDAFGDERSYWLATSPYQRLQRNALPMLLVCSSQRRFPTSPCDEADAMAGKARTLGVAMQVLPEPLDHGEINRNVGLPSEYTRTVARYIDALMR